MKIEDAVGKRCLVSFPYHWFDSPSEVRIKEISPSGEYVCYQLTKTDHRPEWIKIKYLKILEILDEDRHYWT